MRGSWKRVGAFVQRDARHLRRGVVALVALVGMVAVPSFYAWFNIAGSWDPYGNTDNVRVAVASDDAGYSGELVPVSVNLGERVLLELQASETIDYVVTSSDGAVEGVRSGEYYAAIVLPEDFSHGLMTMLSDRPERPQVRFYQNEKENAIASIVTGKAEDAVLADIDRGFAHAVTAVGAGALEELGRALDGDEVVGAAWARLMRGYGFAGDGVPELAVSVLPGHRGRGVGTALLSSLIERCSELGCPALSLSVQRSNPAARLYERLGFREVSGDDGEAVMVLPLGGRDESALRPRPGRLHYPMGASGSAARPI